MGGGSGTLAGPHIEDSVLEQTLKGVGKGILDRGLCSEQVSSPISLLGSPSRFAMGSTWEEGV